MVLIMSGVYAQTQFVITPEGVVSSKDNLPYVLIDIPGLTKEQLLDKAYNGLTANNPYPTSTVEKKEGMIQITGSIPGFTKTDKAAGSAYLFDLNYRMTIEFKDGKLRVLAPVFSLGNQGEFNHSSTTMGITTKSKNEFVLSMEICGKNDIWSNKAKKFYIYDVKHKLVEKTTKAKLENVFNKYIEVLNSKINKEDADW